MFRQRLDLVRERTLAPRHRGQTVVLFALMLPILFIMIGLVVDLGYAYGQKRLTQNVADNGSLAGSQIVGKWVGNPGSATDANVKTAICDIAKQSPGGYNAAQMCSGVAPAGGLPSLVGKYVDTNEAVLGTVGGGFIPANAEGVKLTATVSSQAFFGAAYSMSLFPVSSVATAILTPITGVSPSNPNYAPFTVFYSPTVALSGCGSYLTNQASCPITLGSTQVGFYADGGSYCGSGGVGGIVPWDVGGGKGNCDATFTGKFTHPGGEGDINDGDDHDSDRTPHGGSAVAGTVIVVPVVSSINPGNHKGHIVGWAALNPIANCNSSTTSCYGTIVSFSFTSRKGFHFHGTPPPADIKKADPDDDDWRR